MPSRVRAACPGPPDLSMPPAPMGATIFTAELTIGRRSMMIVPIMADRFRPVPP